MIASKYTKFGNSEAENSFLNYNLVRLQSQVTPCIKEITKLGLQKF